MYFSIVCDIYNESDVYTDFVFCWIRFVDRIVLGDNFVKLVFDCSLIGYDFTSSEVLLYSPRFGVFRRTLPDGVLAISSSLPETARINPLLDVK